MRTRWIAVAIAMVVGVGIGWTATRRGASAEAAESAGMVARNGVELTVYSQDFGMVREARPVRLAAGDNRLALPEVSSQLDPQSVLLGWAEPQPAGAEITAHAYDLGVSDSNALLQRYVGKQVQIVRYGQDGRESERQTGRVMVESGGEVVLQSGGKMYVHPPGTVVAPDLKDVVTIPQLSVQAHSTVAAPAAVSLAYLTRGLSWSAGSVKCSV